MHKMPRGSYSPEFRHEAVKLVEASGLFIAQVGLQLSVPKSRLGGCARAAQEDKLKEIGQGQWIPTGGKDGIVPAP